MSTALPPSGITAPPASPAMPGSAPWRPRPEEGRSLVLEGIGWDAYLTIDEALGEHSAARVAYFDGRLSIVTKSHEHDAGSEYLGDLIGIAAAGCGIACVPAGSTTYRRDDRAAGVEGNKAFYFGAHAEPMKGRERVDLATQPPPDLVVEVELMHPADVSVVAYAALGVPEVWRLDVRRAVLASLRLGPDGSYRSVDKSGFLPALTTADVLQQLAAAERLDLSGWLPELMNWTRMVLLARPRDLADPAS